MCNEAAGCSIEYNTFEKFLIVFIVFFGIFFNAILMGILSANVELFPAKCEESLNNKL